MSNEAPHQIIFSRNPEAAASAWVGDRAKDLVAQRRRDPLVSVDEQYPFGMCQLQCGFTLGGEVVEPTLLNTRARRPCNLTCSVQRGRVDQHQAFVGEAE